MTKTRKHLNLYILFSISTNEHKLKSSQESNKVKKKLKQIESILSQRLIFLSELRQSLGMVSLLG